MQNVLVVLDIHLDLCFQTLLIVRFLEVILYSYSFCAALDNAPESYTGVAGLESLLCLVYGVPVGHKWSHVDLSAREHLDSGGPAAREKSN